MCVCVCVCVCVNTQKAGLARSFQGDLRLFTAKPIVSVLAIRGQNKHHTQVRGFHTVASSAIKPINITGVATGSPHHHLGVPPPAYTHTHTHRNKLILPPHTHTHTHIHTCKAEPYTDNTFQPISFTHPHTHTHKHTRTHTL